MWIVASLVGGILFAEVYGYWLHRLMHSDVIHFVSRNHMIHHLDLYGPRMKQRPDAAYRFSVAGRMNVLGIGLEWLIPIGVTIAAIYGVFSVAGASAVSATVFVGGSLGYSYFLFWHLHNAMHQRETWLSRSRWLSSWFLRARRRHDIHHVRLDADGYLYSNFGIGFAWMDHVFGTAYTRAAPVTDDALHRAHARYRDVIG